MKFYADLHTHTISSGHAFGSIEEMARSANEKQLKYIGIADHGPSLKGAPIDLYFRCAHLCLPKFNNTKILFGCEANIIDYDGTIDLTEEITEFLDLLLVGFHNYTPYTSGSTKQNTDALIKCIKKYKRVDVIAHIGNPAFKVNYEDVIKIANDYDILIEVNNRSFLPAILSARKGSEKNCIEVINLCEKYKVKIVVSSDAHNQTQVGAFELAANILKQENFPESLIVNANESLLDEFINSIHPNKKPKEVLN